MLRYIHDNLTELKSEEPQTPHASLLDPSYMRRNWWGMAANKKIVKNTVKIEAE